jgi:hypothetical protein
MSLNYPTFILYEKAYTGEGFHTTEVNGYIEAHKLLNDTNVFLGGSSYLYMKDAYHKEVLIWSAHLNDEFACHDESNNISHEKVDNIVFHYDSGALAKISKNIFNSLEIYFKNNQIDLTETSLNDKHSVDIEHIISNVLENEDNFSNNNYKATKF